MEGEKEDTQDLRRKRGWGLGSEEQGSRPTADPQHPTPDIHRKCDR